MNRRQRAESAMASHPTAWRPQPAVLRERMAALLRTEGAEHPEVASWALAARGASGLDRHAFAALFDVDESVVASLEEGSLPRELLPPSLLRVLLAGRET